MRIKKYFPVVALLYLFASCISDEVEGGSSEDAVAVGDTLPAFSVTMNDGTVMTSEDLKGKPSLVMFFNTACSDCQKELPVVEQLYERYGSDGSVVFLLISREEDAVAVGNYWNSNGLTLPFSAKTDRTIYHLFASSSIPRIYIVDTTSVVRAVFTDSPLATYQDLEREIERLRKE